MRVVRKKGETVDSLIKRYKRMRSLEGIPEAIKRNDHYVKPSDRRKMKHEAAIHKNKARAGY